MQPTVLILVGSPKGFRSTSASLACYLGAQLQAQGWHEERLHLRTALNLPGGRRDLLAAVESADLVVIATPLYLDAPPYPAILAMELIAEHRQSATVRERRLVAISNCGFPEARHNDTALAIYRRFAREAGFEWAGGLALGAGEVVDDKPLEQIGGMGENIRHALAMAAAALADGKPVPRKAVSLMARPALPRWLYLLMASRGWRRAGQESGAGDLKQQPYVESDL